MLLGVTTHQRSLKSIGSKRSRTFKIFLSNVKLLFVLSRFYIIFIFLGGGKANKNKNTLVLVDDA